MIASSDADQPPTVGKTAETSNADGNGTDAAKTGKSEKQS